jgi:hypothetical protein
MTKTPTILAASLLAALTLSACGSASDDVAPITVPAPTPTVTEADVPTPPEPPVIEDAAQDVVIEDDAHDHDSHDGEAHKNGDAHEDHDDDKHDHDKHDHDDHSDGVGEAHVHGTSEMALIVEGDTLSISFGGPLVNVLGFEHEAKTPEQIQAVNDLKATLADASNLVTLPANAGCTLLETDVQMRNTGTHGTIAVEYNLECRNIAQVTQVNIIGFETFGGLETVDAVVITPAGQTAAGLSRGAASITFPQ